MVVGAACLRGGDGAGAGAGERDGAPRETAVPVGGEGDRQARCRARTYTERRPVQHDFACGTGRAIRLLHGLVRAAHGYDVSAVMLAKARESGAYAAISQEIGRPTVEECAANPRAKPAKLRWARRA